MLKIKGRNNSVKDNVFRLYTEMTEDTEYININRLQIEDTIYKLPTIIKMPKELEGKSYDVENIKYTVMRLCEYYEYEVDMPTDIKHDDKDSSMLAVNEADGYYIPADISVLTVRNIKPDYKIYFNILKAMAKYHKWPTIFEVGKDDE